MTATSARPCTPPGPHDLDGARAARHILHPASVGFGSAGAPLVRRRIEYGTGGEVIGHQEGDRVRQAGEGRPEGGEAEGTGTRDACSRSCGRAGSECPAARGEGRCHEGTAPTLSGSGDSPSREL